MATWRRRWLPSLVAVTAAALNVDLVIMPWLVKHGIHGRDLFIAATFAATCEVFIWYWYAGEVARNVDKNKSTATVRDSARIWWTLTKSILFSFGKPVGFRASAKMWLSSLRELVVGVAFWIRNLVEGKLEISSWWKRLILDKALAVFKDQRWWVRGALLVSLGCIPFGWGFGIAIARSRKNPSWTTLIPLLVTNAIKTYGIGMFVLWVWGYAKTHKLVSLSLIVFGWVIKRMVISAWQRRRAKGATTATQVAEPSSET